MRFSEYNNVIRSLSTVFVIILKTQLFAVKRLLLIFPREKPQWLRSANAYRNRVDTQRQERQASAPTCILFILYNSHFPAALHRIAGAWLSLWLKLSDKSNTRPLKESTKLCCFFLSQLTRKTEKRPGLVTVST